MEPDNIPDRNTPLDQTRPTPPDIPEAESLMPILASACVILFGAIVVLVIVAAMLGH